MSELKKMLLTILVIFLILTAFLWVDDELDPEVLSMVEQATASKESEAFIYLLGIEAAADEDPAIVGKSLLAKMQQADKEFLELKVSFDDYDHEALQYPAEKALPRFELDNCELGQCDYIESLFNHPFDSNTMSENQTILLDRFRTLLSETDYADLLDPHYLTVLPSYQYLSGGNDLNNLKIIEYARNNEIDKALLILEQSISNLRSYLEKADSLIAKMLFTAFLSKNIDLYSVLNQKYQSSFRKSLSPLSQAEKSMEKPMNYETVFSFNMIKLMERDKKQLLDSESSLLRFIPQPITRFVFKPNITMNRSVMNHQAAIRKSVLSFDDFVESLDISKIKTPRIEYLRNYIGATSLEGSDYSDYVTRIFALDAKISLFNEVSQLTLDSIKPEEIRNPFYSNEKRVNFSDDKKSICFDVPTTAIRDRDRCLVIRD